MAVFEYKALDKNGNKTSGIITADSQDSVKRELRQNHIFPTDINRVEEKNKLLNVRDTHFNFFTRIKPADLSLFTRQLSTLLSSGFPLVKAVATLIPQTRSKPFQKVLSQVKDAIEGGSSFAESLGPYPSVFSPVYTNMVKAGESSGTLEIVLERLADFTEKKEDTKKKIQASLAYPVLMTIIGMVVLTILLTYVVPGIVTIFSDMNQILPLPTRILIGVSSFFEAFWWIIILLPPLFLLTITLLRKTRRCAVFFDWLLISFPVLGLLNRKLIAARFTRTLTSLLSNGIPMLTGLHITKSIAGNLILQDLIILASKNIEQGGELGVVLEKSRAFPSLAAQMIKTGEKSGEIEKMLEKTADLYEKEVETAITAATALITPVIILLMGVVVAMIIFAICLPIFEINQLIR